MEKVVADQLMEYLESNQLLSNAQHGFRKNLSTETALTKITETLYDNMDNKNLSLMTLCDLSKAFDSVNHKVLIKKCLDLNIDSFWFENYLENRTQSVRIGQSISNTRSVTFGVPQGSILGPILFLIYINDMKKIANGCLLVMYADDAQFIHTGKVDNISELIRRAEETLAKARRYFLENGLMIIAKKTQVIFIGTRQILSKIPNDIKIGFDNEEIEPSSHVKNLGIHIDKTLTFDVHIDELCKKVTGILLYINRMKDSFDKATRTQIVQALALSTINYCLKIWGTTSKNNILRVQKLQNFAAKVAMGGARKYDHVSPILEELQWLKIDQQINHDICVTIFKLMNNKLPSWLVNLRTVGQIHNRITRQRDNLYSSRTNTNICSRSLANRGPLLWNSLPNLVTGATSLGTFKAHLRKYLLEKQQR